jgi:hypothetical protein
MATVCNPRLKTLKNPTFCSHGIFMLLRSAFFWDFAQRRKIVSYLQASVRNFHRIKVKDKAIPLQACTEFQEVEAPRFQDSRHIKMVRLSAYAPAAFTPRKDSWYSFLLEAESTPGP